MLTIICDNRNSSYQNDDDKKNVNDNFPGCRITYSSIFRFFDTKIQIYRRFRKSEKA